MEKIRTDNTETLKNALEHIDELESLIAEQKKIIQKFFKYIPRIELVTYMGESNVIKAEKLV